MTLADELLMKPGKVVNRFSSGRVDPGLRLPFDGTLSPAEQRMLEQFAFEDFDALHD